MDEKSGDVKLRLCDLKERVWGINSLTIQGKK